MRITGGKWGGLTLQVPKGQDTRPTSDANRESIFNILAHGLGHAPLKVLDLFAGTGALSFESLSRGAEACCLVESSPNALKTIEKNREKLPVSEALVQVLSEGKIEKWPALISKGASDFWPFDTIFCDPPYSKGLVEKALKNLEKVPQIFALDALLIAEISSQEVNISLKSWEIIQERSRGATKFLFYRRSEC